MAKVLRASVWGAVLGVALTGVALQAHAETLADAIAQAYQSNPTLQAQRVQLRYQDEQYVQARAGYRPTLQGQAQLAYRSSRQNPCRGQFIDGCGDNTPELNELIGSLTFQQPIYTSGRATAAVNQAEADILTQRENLRNVENQVMLDTITAYVDVRRDEQALAIRLENLNVLKRQVEEAKARFDVGEVTKTDVAQAEAELAQAQASFSVAQAQLAVSRAEYANVVGHSPGDLAPEPELKLAPKTIDEAFATAERNAPPIRSADYSTQSAEFQVQAAKAATKPTVSIQSTFTYANTRFIPFTPNDFNRQLDVSLVVTQPLYAGGVRESQIRQAVERENFFRIQAEGARRTTVQTVSQAWNRLLAGRAAVAADMEQVRAARVAYEGAVEEQKVGLRTTFEVLQQEQILRDAELSLNSARHDTYLATAQVLQGTGLLEARLLIPDIPVQPAGHAFHQLKNATGYVPWEEVVKALDSTNSKGVTEAPPPLDAPIDMPITTAKPADIGKSN